MGLTVHFKLAAPTGVNAARAEQMVASVHRLAVNFQREGRVDDVSPVTSDAAVLRRNAREWLILPVPGGKNSFTEAEVPPLEGFIFQVNVGADCEPFWLGLCRYPPTVLCQGRKVPTKMGAGWRLARFSKTQYASLHGWEHFERCHCAVVEMLAALRSLGLRVRISDEGEYWPRRSLASLRRNLDQMNGLIAASAGAWKDADSGVESPIFRNPHFERLEAEGDAKHGALIRQTRRLVVRRKRP
jgi:hypothetical protein